MWCGHGTGRSGNSDEIVDQIFSKGLRTKDNSLYYTIVINILPLPPFNETNRFFKTEDDCIKYLYGRRIKTTFYVIIVVAKIVLICQKIVIE